MKTYFFAKWMYHKKSIILKNMKFRRIILLIVSTFGIILGVVAQDVHFSQFESAPNFLNPALGGQYYGDWQAGTTLREQWRSIDRPYQSFEAFLDRKINYYSQQVNVGMVVIHDKSGNAQLTSDKVYLSLAYPFKTGRSTVSVGIQPGMVIRYYSDNLTYPTQFDNSTGYFNSGLNNYENSNYGNTNKTYFDMNVGVLWKLNLPKIKPMIGISLMHINRPDDSFNNAVKEQKIRQTIHANAKISGKKDIYVKPAIYFSQLNKAQLFLVGGEAGRYFKGSDKPINEVFAGIYARTGINRNTDAISPVIGFQYMQWRFGMSYDINISDLSKASDKRGAFELSLIYRAANSVPKHTAIPCDRY